MSNTVPSQNDTSPAKQDVDFRRLPLAALQLPEKLFDPRDITEADKAVLPYPVTVYQSGERFVLIDGCKRFVLAQKAGMEEISCMVLTPSPAADLVPLLRMRLNRSRTLRFFEKLLFISWLAKNTDDQSFRTICSEFSIDNREAFELKQLSDCEPGIIDAVAAGALERSLAPELQRLDPDDRTAILSFIRTYSLSRQMQREFFDWLPELAFREHCSVNRILTLDELIGISSDAKLNGPQKIDKIREFLYNRRFPTLARAKQTWKEHAAKLNPAPRQVQFKAADAFEKNRLDLRITLSSAEEAKEIFTKLSTIEPMEWNCLIYPAQLSQ
jgi:hypothetical protein